MSSTRLPYTDQKWKIPGYTGYVEGMKETFKKTPIQCQSECYTPQDGSFLYSRQREAIKESTEHDPCNNEEATRKPSPGILWPNLQHTAAQDPFRPPKSNVSLGDSRINAFKTSYGLDYDAPFEKSKCIRSPMRNYDLSKPGVSLHNHYLGSYNRVGQERLQKMMTRMRERLAAKLGNSNDNGFKLRKLFKMYDHENSGKIQLEDFRMMTESFGMQLDDDSLLALYHVYDPKATGFLDYTELMGQLLDPDYYALYVGRRNLGHDH